MNKKLLAVAVAGALAGPGLAFAQASTVQIYGTVSFGPEYRSATGADASAAPPAGSSASSVRAGSGGVTAAGGSLATNNGATVPGPAVGTNAAYPFVANNLGGGYSTNPANQDWRTATTGPGSNFGFRGKEDLGRGLYAGFQYEVGIHGAGDTQWTGGSNGNLLSSRNSGVWLGSPAMGEFGVGLWDTPFASIMYNNGGSVYGNSSTSMAAGLLGGLSIAQGTYSGYGIGSYCAANNGATAASCFAAMTSFARRQENSLWWQSPNWGGLSVRAQYGVNQPYTTATTGASSNQQGSSIPGTGAQMKPSVWGISASYTNGGLFAGLGYEAHNNYSAIGLRSIAGYMTTPVITLGSTGNGLANQLATFNTAAMTSSDDWGVNLNLRYQMQNGFGVGAYYEKLQYSWNYAPSATSFTDVTKLSRDAYRLDGNFKTGPHMISLTYGHANSLSGTTGIGFNGGGTETSEWMLDYAYSFSKRTSLFAYFNLMKNDTNARAAGIVFNGIATAAGADPKYVGLGIKHTF